MNDIRRIKINVAYKEILVYDTDGSKLYPNSNISECDIQPWHALDVHRINKIGEKYGLVFPHHLREDDSSEIKHFLNGLNSHKFDDMLDNSLGNFNIYSLDEIYPTSENFIYPIVLYNNDLFLKYETIDLAPELIKCVKDKRAKICFIQATEGFFGKKADSIMWLSNLSKKYGFEKDGLIMITSNLIADEKYQYLVSENVIPDNVTIYPYAYFQHKLWFAGNGNLCPDNKVVLQETFDSFLRINRKKRKTHHFLAFSRVPKSHRIALFGELMTNEKFKNKNITSLGGVDNNNPKGHYDMSDRILEGGYRNKKTIQEFYKTYDSTKHYTYDEDDLENNKASSFNEDAHRSTFVNIITESSFSPKSVFFSEKTYKPILACQPFIMLCNPHSLKKLKEQGFKTFDKWWDESYDEETNFTKRFSKIIDIMEEISMWDMEKCFRITNEMEEILVHNFNTMIDDTPTFKLYSFLKSNIEDAIISPIVSKSSKRKILGVCGDDSVSFTDSLSTKLNWDIVSFARHGCNNSIIRLQIDEIIKLNPNYVIIGFVSPSNDSNWEKQQDTWIIADGLRKLMEHNIKFSFINNGQLFENDLYFVKDNIELHTADFETLETLVNKWYTHFVNNDLVENVSKQKLI